MAKIILERTPEGGHIWIDSKEFDRVVSFIDLPDKTLRQLILEDTGDKMGWRKYMEGGEKENKRVVRLLSET